MLKYELCLEVCVLSVVALLVKDSIQSTVEITDTMSPRLQWSV